MQGTVRSAMEVYQEAIAYTMENAGNRGQKSADAMCAKKFVELLGLETLKLANRHGNIKPREVKKYFGIEE
jgi:hypothetical protein